MTKFGFYFYAILVIFLGGCSQNSSTQFSTNDNLNSSSAKFEGDVSDPGSIAFFKNNVGDRVLFAIDQSDIDEAGKYILLDQVDWLLANADYKIIIEGHADERGTREYNLALGARRANSAREFLVSRGIESARIQTVSFGKERPVELCSNEKCYSENRRAVSVVSNLNF
jgi:peptidoglycan-associated lipoprotein